MTVDAVGFFGTLVDVLWLALAVAIGVWVLAGAWVVGRLASRWLERRYLPLVARWSRRRAGLVDDAGPWACPVCSSVNGPTMTRCYDCSVPRPGDAPELRDAATDPSLFHRPPPVSHFDPSLYRGPGAPLSLGGPGPAEAEPPTGPRPGPGHGRGLGPGPGTGLVVPARDRSGGVAPDELP